jgi:SAM-dependent methyltransferase
MSTLEKNDYIKIIQNSPWLYEPIMTNIRLYAENSKSITDIGCGNGYLLTLLSKEFPTKQLTGIDFDNFMINKLHINLPFTFYKKDAENFFIKSDVTISNLSLHHFINPHATLKKLHTNSNIVLIISDQLRPKTISELNKRLHYRNNFIGSNDVPYYKTNERESILEAYSKKEVLQIFNNSKLQYKIYFYDNDYYERFVAIFEK